MTSPTPQIDKGAIFGIKQYLLLFLGLGICGYFIYIRIILQRLPKEIKQEWYWLRFAIYLGLFILFTLLFLKKVTGKESNAQIIMTLKEKIFIPFSQIYEKSLTRVYDYFIDEGRIPIKFLISKSLDALYSGIHYLASKNVEFNSLAAYYIINLTPRVLVVIGLGTDVFIFKKFEYAYKIMPILILPLLVNVGCYILREFVDLQMELLEYLVDVEIVVDGDGSHVQCSIKEGLSKEAEEQFTPELMNTLTQTAQKYISIKQNFLESFGPQSTIPLQPIYHWSLICVYMCSALIWGSLAISMGYTHILTLINIHWYL